MRLRRQATTLRRALTLLAALAFSLALLGGSAAPGPKAPPACILRVHFGVRLVQEIRIRPGEPFDVVTAVGRDRWEISGDATPKGEWVRANLRVEWKNDKDVMSTSTDQMLKLGGADTTIGGFIDGKDRVRLTAAIRMAGE